MNLAGMPFAELSRWEQVPGGRGRLAPRYREVPFHSQRNVAHSTVARSRTCFPNYPGEFHHLPAVLLVAYRVSVVWEWVYQGNSEVSSSQSSFWIIVRFP